jgi:hypothetical protein
LSSICTAVDVGCLSITEIPAKKTLFIFTVKLKQRTESNNGLVTRSNLFLS